MGGEGQRDGIVGCSHASHEIDDCVNYIMQFISDQIAPCDPTTTFGGHQENGSFLIAAAFVTGRLRREVLWGRYNASAHQSLPPASVQRDFFRSSKFPSAGFSSIRSQSACVSGSESSR